MTLDKPDGGVLVRQYADRLGKLLHVELLAAPVERPFVLLGTGSRRAEREAWEPVVQDCVEVVTLWLRRFRGVHRPVMRQGEAPGVDQMWKRAGHASRWERDSMPADWNALGKAAGPVRNQAMVDKGADLCVGIVTTIESVGTRDCLQRAHLAGIPTLIITVDDLYLPQIPPRSTW
jgi:isopentenyl diphosphate isomerase/L-lactate dehydrogenase-like FMN-dependent dehydrogenase